jgi:hypothetical protein
MNTDFISGNKVRNMGAEKFARPAQILRDRSPNDTFVPWLQYAESLEIRSGLNEVTETL